MFHAETNKCLRAVRCVLTIMTVSLTPGAVDIAHMIYTIIYAKKEVSTRIGDGMAVSFILLAPFHL